jgi:hypothetical protein
VTQAQRTGKNLGGYRGERIDISMIQRALAARAAAHGWRTEAMPAANGLILPAYQRPAATTRRRIYLSSGIHGDEPAGPLALLQLLDENAWPADAALWLCPCLNPDGFARNTRENRDGVDLNRDYRDPRSAEVSAHIRWLQRQPRFDFALCLHEDWEARGFYVYEINRTGGASLAARMIPAVAPICPIDPSPEIDGFEARDGIISPAVDLDARPLWPEAFYLRRHHTPHTCTLEAPSDFPLEVRVRALVAGVRAALHDAAG